MFVVSFFHSLGSPLWEGMWILQSWKMCMHHKILSAFTWWKLCHSASCTCLRLFRRHRSIVRRCSSQVAQRRNVHVGHNSLCCCATTLFKLLVSYSAQIVSVSLHMFCYVAFARSLSCRKWMLSLVVAGLEPSGDVPVEELLTLLTSCVAVSDNVLSAACSAVPWWLILLATHCQHILTSTLPLSHYLRINGWSPGLCEGYIFIK